MQQGEQTDATLLEIVASVCTQLKVWPVSNRLRDNSQQRNNMQQGEQTDAKLLANNSPTLLGIDAFVCT